jgi:hypothetical protein
MYDFFLARKSNSSVCGVMEVFSNSSVLSDVQIHGTSKNRWLHEECIYIDGSHEGPESN